MNILKPVIRSFIAVALLVGAAAIANAQTDVSRKSNALDSFRNQGANKSNVDQILAESQTLILNQLKNATSFRIADRTQNQDFFAPEIQRLFNKQKLHEVCVDVTRALFDKRNRVTNLGLPTASVEHNGVSSFAKEAEKIYPQCRKPGSGNKGAVTVSRNGGWRNADVYLSAAALKRPETRFYQQDDSVFLVTSKLSKSGERNAIGVLMAAGLIDECPVYSDEAYIVSDGKTELENTASMLRIDGKVAQLFLIGKPLYPEDIDDQRRLDELNLSAKDFAFEIFNQTPNDKPRRGEKVLIVNLPPYSPLMPPIARKVNDIVPNSDPYRDPRFSQSIIPTCFIYFR